MDVSDLLRLKEERRKKKRNEFINAFKPSNKTNLKRICTSQGNATESANIDNSVSTDNSPPETHNSDEIGDQYFLKPKWVNAALKEIENACIQEEYMIVDPTYDTEKPKKMEFKKAKKSVSILSFEDEYEETQDDNSQIRAMKVDALNVAYDEDIDAPASKYLSERNPPNKPSTYEPLPDDFLEDEENIYGTKVKKMPKLSKDNLEKVLQEFDTELNVIQDEFTKREYTSVEEELTLNDEHLKDIKTFIETSKKNQVKITPKEVENSVTTFDNENSISGNSDDDFDEDVSEFMDQVWRQRAINQTNKL